MSIQERLKFLEETSFEIPYAEKKFDQMSKEEKSSWIFMTKLEIERKLWIKEYKNFIKETPMREKKIMQIKEALENLNEQIKNLPKGVSPFFLLLEIQKLNIQLYELKSEEPKINSVNVMLMLFKKINKQKKLEEEEEDI